MQKPSRLLSLFLLALLITWYAPMTLNNNIASAVILHPSLITNPATNIKTTNATLNGYLTSKGNDTTSAYGFQYGLTTSYAGGYVYSTNLTPGFTQIQKRNERNGNKGIWGDGTYIYTVNYGFGNSSIYAYSFNGTTATLLNTTYDARANQEYQSIWGDGTYIYVTANGGGINAYSFNGTSMHLNATKFDAGGDYYGVWGDGTYIYTTCEGSGIRAYTFNGATNTFTLKGTKFDGGTYYGVWGDGTYIYIACDSSGVRSYTFDGTNFHLTATQHDAGNYYSVWGDGTYIYCGCLANGLRAYSFSGVAFTLIDTDFIGGFYWGIYGDGNYIYVADYQAGAPGFPDVLAYSFNGTALTLQKSYSDINYYYETVWSDNAFIYATSFTDSIIAYTFGTGAFTYNLTGLTPGTTYHYRSFANNSLYTGYGNDMMFYTGVTNGARISIYVDVYNESNGSQAIPFNIIIKNLNGSEVYSNLNQHGTTNINTTALSGNQTILIKVWSLGYRERIMLIQLHNNLSGHYTFYLPAETMPPGADPGGGSGYGPNASIVPLIYTVRVVETIRTEYSEFDRPIAGAWVNIKRYINATGRFETMSILQTDTNGYINLYLIPSVLYLFNISATDYITSVADWNPTPPNPYQPTELKIFRMTRTSHALQPVNVTYIMKNIIWSLAPQDLSQQGPITFYFNITSTDNQLQWFRMEVSYFNQSLQTWVLLNSQNQSTSSGGSLTYTTANITGTYKVDVYLKKIGYNEYKIYETGNLHYTLYYLPIWIRQIPDFVWYLIIVVLMIIVMGTCFTMLSTGLLTGYIGLGVFAFGLMLKPGLTINGFGGWVIWAITFLIYTMGIFLWSRL